MAAPRRKWSLLKARYLEQLEVQDYAKRTVESIEANLRFFLEYLEEETAVGDLALLTHDDLGAYQTWLYCSGSRKDRGEAALLGNAERAALGRPGLLRLSPRRRADPSRPVGVAGEARGRKPLPRQVLSEPRFSRFSRPRTWIHRSVSATGRSSNCCTEPESGTRNCGAWGSPMWTAKRARSVFWQGPEGTDRSGGADRSRVAQKVPRRIPAPPQKGPRNRAWSSSPGVGGS